MTLSARADLEMRQDMPATFESVEQFVVDFRERSKALLDPKNRFSAELLLREALANAVRHGSHADPNKQVRCRLRIKRRRLLIAVEDYGCGFDWRRAWDNQAGAPECSGRGVEILRKYSSHVRYNDRGNAVIIVKRFVEEKQP
jgi:anti-sigma regulatory factor (Ser/Thr protein kinase)